MIEATYPCRKGVHERIVRYLTSQVVDQPWGNHAALMAAVLAARRQDARESTRGADPSGVTLRRLAVWTPGPRCTYLHRDADERIAPDFAKLFGPAC